MLIVPPVIVTIPVEVESSSSGLDLMPSFPEVTFIVPPATVTLLSEARPLFTAVMFSVRLPPTVISAEAAPLMPFLQFPTTFKVPSPQITAEEPVFTLITAPSKVLFEAPVSFASSSLSVSVTVPVTKITVEVDLLRLIGEVVLQARSRSSRMSVTSVTPFFTVMLPSEQEPVIV